MGSTSGLQNKRLPSGAAGPRSTSSKVKLPHRVEVLAVDFDRTLVACHTGARNMQPAEVRERPPEADAVDPRLLCALAEAAEARGYPLVVATFGRRQVVREYLDVLIGANRAYILTPTDVGGRDNVSVRGGKVPQLDLCLRIFNSNRRNLLFIDDSRKNVRSAKDAGYRMSFAVPNGLDRRAWSRVQRRLSKSSEQQSRRQNRRRRSSLSR